MSVSPLPHTPTRSRAGAELSIMGDGCRLATAGLGLPTLAATFPLGAQRLLCTPCLPISSRGHNSTPLPQPPLLLGRQGVPHHGGTTSAGPSGGQTARLGVNTSASAPILCTICPLPCAHIWGAHTLSCLPGSSCSNEGPPSLPHG